MDNETGCVLTITDDKGLNTVIEVAAGAVQERVTLAYKLHETLAATTASNLVATNRVFELNAYRDTTLVSPFTFLKPLVMTLEYADAGLTSEQERTLMLYVLDGMTWVQVADGASSLDTTANRLVVETSRTGTFGLFYTEAQTSDTYMLFLPLVER